MSTTQHAAARFARYLFSCSSAGPTVTATIPAESQTFRPHNYSQSGYNNIAESSDQIGATNSPCLTVIRFHILAVVD